MFHKVTSDYAPAWEKYRGKAKNFDNNKKKKEKGQLMTDNEIGDKGAKTLSEALKVNTTLKTLNLASEEERGKRKRKHE